MDATSDYSIELLKLLYVFSFSLGFWTCLSTLVNKQIPKEVKLVLMIFISILLVMPLNGYLALILDEPPLVLGSLASTLTWCYGPLIMLFVNHVTQKQQHTPVVLLHFAPFLTVTIIHLYKLEWLTFAFYQYILLVQTGVYLAISLTTLYFYRKRILILGREFKNSTYHWMLYLIGGLFAIVVYDNALVFLLKGGAEISFYFVAMTVGGISVYISTIAIFLLFQPDIFDVKTTKTEADIEAEPSQETPQPSIQVNVDSHTPERTEHDADPVTAEHSRNLDLSSTAAAEMGKNLQDLMNERKSYLESDISLSKLSETLGVSNHHLSELLNFHLKTNFYDYLNTFRFKEAIRIMQSEPKKHSVTDIAYLSGFNNRNTFYRVFKENTGLTPGEYRKQQNTASRPIAAKKEEDRAL